MPSSVAICSPPPWPKISDSCWQWGHTKYAMFSTMPSVGMLSFLYIATARRESASDTCCGVVTTMAPATGTVWLRLRATSPVPGGMSITR